MGEECAELKEKEESYLRQIDGLKEISEQCIRNYDLAQRDLEEERRYIVELRHQIEILNENQSTQFQELLQKLMDERIEWRSKMSKLSSDYERELSVKDAIISQLQKKNDKL